VIFKRSAFLVLGLAVAFIFAFNSEICSTRSSNPQEPSYIIDWDVLDSGGEKLTSSRFLLLNSVGQPPIGESEGGKHSKGFGYWYIFQSFIAGDINGDGVVDITDVVYMVNYLLKSGPRPVPFWVGDVNCDTRINLSDPVYLANYILKSGPPPCADP